MLFVDALAILKDLRRCWPQIEIDIGSFDKHGDVTADEVLPLNIAVLDMCVRAYFEDIQPGDEESLLAATDPDTPS